MLKFLFISNKSEAILLIQLQVDIGFSKLEFSEMPTLLRENTAMFPLGLKSGYWTKKGKLIFRVYLLPWSCPKSGLPITGGFMMKMIRSRFFALIAAEN